MRTLGSCLRIVRVGATAALVALATNAMFAQRLTWFDSFTSAFDVSDGGVVVGTYFTASGNNRAFRWENGVRQDLGTLGGSQSRARAVSADGRVVVGWAQNANGQIRAFRWENGVMQDLGTLGGSQSEALGVSSDGSVVVGYAYNSLERPRAFIWTQGGGMQEIGSLPGSPASYAYAASADGSVVVGRSYISGGIRAIRWANGMQNLGTLGGSESVAYSVSADGRVVVGEARNALGERRAFRWTAHLGMENLGVLPGGEVSVAYDISADGRVIVGQSGSSSAQGRGAFRWTPSRGIENLNITYASLLTNGATLSWAAAISPNGRYIVGAGRRGGNNDAFLLDTGSTQQMGDVNGDRCVDSADLLAVLFAFGQSGSSLPEDVNGDGAVDDADLLTVLFNFGEGC